MSKRLLLVDDDVVLLKSVEGFLSDCTGLFETDICFSVDDAVHLSKIEEYDLIITDINMPEKTADMLKMDLKAAGIDYQDEAGRYFDFHALRGELGTLLSASGTHPKVAQSIMRHSDINLTMSLYTHSFFSVSFILRQLLVPCCFIL